MSPVPTFAAQLHLAAIFLATLAVIGLVGRLLLPASLLHAPKMLRLAAAMGGGLVFVTGVLALLCLGHMHATTWLALAQAAAVAVLAWRQRKQAESGSGSGPAATPPTVDAGTGGAAWTWAQRLAVLGVGVAVAVLAVLPMIWWRADGGIYPLHEDMGFYIGQVLALPEAQAANPWSIFMGAHTLEATGIRDTWYHWGGLFLATGIRMLTGLDAAPAVLLVANGVLTFILMLAAAALADTLWRLRPATAALAGAAAILGLHFVRLLPGLLDVLAQALPFDVFHHVRVTLAMTFPYKHEGVLLLLTLALWQARHPRLALAVLFAAACSAPHSVAVAGAATGTLAGLGLLLRDRALLRTGASATGVTLAGWAVMHFLFGAGLADKQGAPAMGLAPLAEMPRVLRDAALDLPATALMSAFFVASAVFLVRQGRRQQNPQTATPQPAAGANTGVGANTAAMANTSAGASTGTGTNQGVGANTRADAAASPNAASGEAAGTGRGVALQETITAAECAAITAASRIGLSGAAAAATPPRQAPDAADRAPRPPATAADPRRVLGWLCLSGLAGSLLAMHALRCGDRFHVVMLTHAVLIMPVGVCGLVGMARLLSGWQRTAAVAVLACVVGLGLHAQVTPLFKAGREAWRAQDVAGLRAQLQGRPVGYYARGDRNWWISKHGLLGGLAGSRILRLNPLDESSSLHYSPYACTLPLRWLPPQGEETTSAWTLRLAHQLGVKHVLETAEDRLPKRLRENCRPVWSGSGLMLYELPEAEGPVKKVAGR